MPTPSWIARWGHYIADASIVLIVFAAQAYTREIVRTELQRYTTREELAQLVQSKEALALEVRTGMASRMMAMEKMIEENRVNARILGQLQSDIANIKQNLDRLLSRDSAHMSSPRGFSDADFMSVARDEKGKK